MACGNARAAASHHVVFRGRPRAGSIRVTKKRAKLMEEFEARLTAAYQAWHESRGRTPDRFFSLYADEIELHSILEASLNDTMRGVFIGKQAAIAYFAA